MTNPVIIGKATLWNMDCMNYMATLPDNAFDLAIVDPPYGIKQDGHRENNRSKLAPSKNYHKALWSQPTPTAEYFRELERVSRNQIVWGGNHLAGLIGKNSPSWLVWKKFTTGNFADCELAYTSFSTAVRLFEYPWNGMIQGFHGSKSKNEVRIHPTQKPIALYEWILDNYAEPGQRILDTHLGSMSSAIAANRMGFELHGTEIEEVHFEEGAARVREDLAQERLFA
jgi:site-specific DNA-methyltransferase (adenine-specific)